jgi:hypothetical protein
MALIWLRVYPTYEVLGFLFSLNNGKAQRSVADVLAAHTVFTCGQPVKERLKWYGYAAAEDLNGQIQLIKARARGFRRFPNFRVAILFYLGKLDLKLQKTR